MAMLHDEAAPHVKNPAGAPRTPPDAGEPLEIAGEAYLRASDAARVIADAGVGVLSAGDRLRAHARAGDIRTYAVHRRSWLYRQADVRAVAERIRKAAW